MNVYDAIAARRSIREFADRAISTDVLHRIIGAGLLAPSHNHLREWHFISVESGRIRAELVRFFSTERTDDELRALLDSWNMTDQCQRAMYLEAIPRQARMVLEAPTLLIPCYREREELLGAKTSLHQLNAFASMWAVLENMLVAAASEGIHGVTKIISSPEERNHLQEALSIPAECEIPCYLPLGYPAEGAVYHPQVPVGVSSRLYSNAWTGEDNFH